MSNNNVMKTKDPYKSEKYFYFGGFECFGVILIHNSTLLGYSTGMTLLGFGPPLNFG
jgi:hypothetical protein